MNWDRIEGQWKQRRGKALRHWGKLMTDELAAIAGKHEEAVGRLQEKYGIASEETKRRLSEFQKTIKRLQRSNKKLLAEIATLVSRDGKNGKDGRDGRERKYGAAGARTAREKQRQSKRTRPEGAKRQRV